MAPRVGEGRVLCTGLLTGEQAPAPAEASGSKDLGTPELLQFVAL